MVPWSHSLQCSQPLRVKAFVGAAAAGGNGYKPPPLVSLRRSPGHPGRSAHGSRVSRNAQTDAAGQGPTRVPGVSGKLERRVIRGSKLGAGNSERLRFQWMEEEVS
ncbi:hypothetical protein I79_002910 [Cricetulus griseus]|uniref:Uncharacterized protein n=1 Tax=Cricetulus griseus TaxID=10029 RepID=G3GYT2_CRIGR|nr:hypothetical protein I79_002910 [Cricetulus griseus]